MKFKALLTTAVWCLAASASSALTLASSDFDTSDEGWLHLNDARGFEWLAEGGDPGGHVSVRDFRSDSLWFVVAPSAHLGNKASAYGGSLSFSLRTDSSPAPLADDFADVQLLGKHGVRLAFGGDFEPVTSWSQHAIAQVAPPAMRIGGLAVVDGSAAAPLISAAVVST